MMRNLRLVLAYEGANYVGWQRQSQPNSIQQMVEEAISRVTGETATVAAASRTDAGVHALGQVAAFATESRLSPAKLLLALNAHLPEDIAVSAVHEVPPVFHPRYHALAKTYEYLIVMGQARPALERGFCWHFPGKLDIEEMRRAAALFVGERDFAAFGSENFRRKSTVRTLYELTLAAAESRLRLHFRGDAFLYNMVRAITGTLVDVGRGKLSAEAVGGILESRDRRRAGRTAPAKGLCLMSVEYADWSS